MRGSAPINLANEPFRHDRPLVVLALVITVVLAGVLMAQTAFGLIERSERLELYTSIAQADGQLARITAERSGLQAKLQGGGSAGMLEYAVFLNQLLMRKGISWTKLFEDLEAVVPHNVRVVSIRPQVTTANQIVLDMTVASQTTEPVIEMLMKLEGSPLFGATAVTHWLPPSQAEPLYRYRVNVHYAPKL